MRAEFITNIGLVRANNEDAVYAAADKQLLIVADGMGGHLSGEVASSLAVQALAQTVEHAEADEPVQILRSAFQQANQRIFQASSDHPENSGMGTTLTALWAIGDQLYVAHVGDSRAFLLHAGEMISLTKDHSLVGELLREGGLTEAQAMVHPQRNILTRALGSNEEVEVDIADYHLATGDRLFLCTDGLSNLVSSAEIARHIGHGDLKNALDQLLALALERGGQDNITAILAENS